MIDFLPADSSIFVANKSYCETVSKLLESAGFSVSGSCSSYGYSLKASAQQKGCHLILILDKSQSTQGGLLNPGAIDSAEGSLSVAGLESSPGFRLGQSGLLRLCCNKKIRSKFPRPFYFFSSGILPSDAIDALAAFAEENRIYLLRLKADKARLKFHRPVENLLAFLADADRILNIFQNQK